jgi:aspartate oxidase
VSETPQAKAKGGDKIRMACEANADYTDATFAQTRPTFNKKQLN